MNLNVVRRWKEIDFQASLADVDLEFDHVNITIYFCDILKLT